MLLNNQTKLALYHAFSINILIINPEYLFLFSFVFNNSLSLLFSLLTNFKPGFIWNYKKQWLLNRNYYLKLQSCLYPTPNQLTLVLNNPIRIDMPQS